MNMSREADVMRMKYMKFGEGEKVMVMIPGLSLTDVSDDPAPVAEAYRMFDEEFTVYLFDRREDVEEGYSIEQMADDTVKKMNELGLKDIYLFGVSQGGMICQYIALKYPKLVKKMVLASTAARFDNDNAGEWIRLAEEKKPVELADAFCRMVYSKGFYESFRSFLPALYGSLPDEQLRRFTIYAKAVNGFDLSERVKEIDVPVLVLGSREDKVIDPVHMEELAKSIEGSELYLYDGYSHAVYDEADDFKERIMDFFLRD